MTASPLLSLPGAVAGDGADAPVAAHYGSFNLEQRTLASGEGFVDLSHRDVVRIAGPDRLTWLHSLTSQAFEGLAPSVWTSALILSPQGHVEHFFSGVDDGSSFLAWTEPGAGEALVGYLERMKFWSDVTITLETSQASVWRPAQGYSFVPRDSLETYAAAAGPACGFWAFEALRIERGEPRFGVDTDARTIPNEVGWVPGSADVVGAEYAVHLDGSENRLPTAGSELVFGEKTVGFVGSSARHHELGPIALGLVKRNVPVDAQLVVDGMPVAQEVLVDPEIGLHIRPLR